ncbi:MAG: glycoside hydrolase family 3 N-terminal domain-containing protein [Pseudomonadota bacterium]|nr:glycoside hydrolase family 3 N-terminal domain-containing protein [Pseudomonadota bacterium]
MTVQFSATIHPEIWRQPKQPAYKDAAAVEARIESILESMTLEEKVGQLIQADIASIKPDDLLRYPLGAVLNGGNSAPDGDNHAPASVYLSLADAFYDASVDPRGGRAAIPVLWGTDAVHGHNNIMGATLFPHNVGLGAARDPDLMRRIAEVTAREVSVTGMDWTFAPTLAVVRDDRWGRSFESYSEDPQLVASYSSAIVEGLQGAAAEPDFLGDGRVIATAKHFLGDGGTDGGKDQGDTLATEEELRDIHGAGYPPAIEAGVQTVMASFSCWRGLKLHGAESLLTQVLKDRMGFDGFVVGDWNGHGQVPGCTNASCPAAINAGLDMVMAPDSWKELYANTLAQVEEGVIPMTRLDDAVRRILRVKIRYGLFERGRPSSRSLAGRYEILGSPDHRAVAREAVRKSLVLLKNNGGLLPLNPTKRILIAGDGADSISKQSGGWSITWQGEGNTNEDFPNGQSIYAGLAEAIVAAGGKAALSPNGSFDETPDAAIVIFGENPYAEFQGDRADVDFDDDGPLAVLKALKAQGVPVVSVFLSGRPLYVNPEINASDAFVAAWLPGTEGGGVADVLLAGPDGRPEYDFIGRLAFSWPKTPSQTPLNAGEPQYDPLFPYGYGLTYADNRDLPLLEEAAVECKTSAGSTFMTAGRARPPYKLTLESAGVSTALDGPRGGTPDGAISARSIDRNAQEDARELRWTAPGAFVISGVQQDLSRQANARMTLSFYYAVAAPPQGAVRAGLRSASGVFGYMDMTAVFKEAAGKGWRKADLPLSELLPDEAELKSVIEPFVIESDGRLALQLSSVQISMRGPDSDCQE